MSVGSCSRITSARHRRLDGNGRPFELGGPVAVGHLEEEMLAVAVGNGEECKIGADESTRVRGDRSQCLVDLAFGEQRARDLVHRGEEAVVPLRASCSSRRFDTSRTLATTT